MMSQGTAGEEVEASPALTKQFVTDDWVDGLNLINILMGNLPFVRSTFKMDESCNLTIQLRWKYELGKHLSYEVL